MGKMISWIALAFFILVVPFISWYYLKQGFDYRRALLSETTPKTSIPLNLDTFQLFKGKTSIFSPKGFVLTKNLAEGLNQQFGKIKNFQLVGVDTVSGVKVLPLGYLNPYFDDIGDQQIVLIDTALRVRHVYNNDMESIKKLVEHITVVLPRQKESDIELKK